MIFLAIIDQSKFLAIFCAAAPTLLADSRDSDARRTVSARSLLDTEGAKNAEIESFRRNAAGPIRICYNWST